MTYQQLDDSVRSIAAELQKLGASGERALLLYSQGLDYIAAFFGCLYASVVAVPTYPPRRNHPDSRLQAIAEDAEALSKISDIKAESLDDPVSETPVKTHILQ